jgi:hypothetical protein
MGSRNVRRFGVAVLISTGLLLAVAGVTASAQTLALPTTVADMSIRPTSTSAGCLGAGPVLTAMADGTVGGYPEDCQTPAQQASPKPTAPDPTTPEPTTPGPTGPGPTTTAPPTATPEPTTTTPQPTATPEPTTTTAPTTAPKGNIQVLSATLTGRQEVPPADREGRGFATVTLSADRTRVCYLIVVTGLKGTATLAHIHKGLAGANGPIVVPLSPPVDGSSAACVKIEAALGRYIADHPRGYYVNVHTSDFPGGAIRGQLHLPYGSWSAVPPPATSRDS